MFGSVSTPDIPASAGESEEKPEPAKETTPAPATEAAPDLPRSTPESAPESAQMIPPQATSVETPDEKAQRDKGDEKKRERSFTIKIASITAASALAGALVGGFFTFGAAKLQSETDADNDQIAMKKEAFSTFLADADKLTHEEGLMSVAIEVYSSTKDTEDRRGVTLNMTSYVDAQRKYVISSNVVSLVGSNEIESARIALVHNTNATADDIRLALGDLGAGKPVDVERSKAFDDKRTQRQSLITDFVVAARRDLVPEQHGLLDIF